MAPKRKAKRADSEEDAGELSEDYAPSVGDDDSGSDYELEDDKDSDDEKPKKKAPAKRAAPAKKAAPAAKRTPAKKKAKADSDEEAGSSGKGKAKAKPAPKRPKPMKITEPTTLDDGWTLHPPSLMYKTNPKAQGGTKIACFDFDGTLVGTKSGADFARTADDWKWFNKEVPTKLRTLHEEGYQLLIVSNQGGVKSALAGAMSEKVRGRCDQMVAALNRDGEVPLQVLMATLKDEYRKPDRGMWDFFVQHMNAGVQPDISQSFFCGDMAGRDGDVGDGQGSDEQFAVNIGLPFFTPEQQFGPSTLKDPLAPSTNSSGENVELATVFRRLAEIVAGEHFKAAAYKKAADQIDAFPAKITSATQLKGVPGIGKSSLAKVTEFLTTGTLAMLEEAGAGVSAPEDKKAEVGLKFL